MTKLIVVVSTFLLVSFAMGQQPKQYSFTHYTTNSGLLSNQVNTVVQDEEGYIWTGTTDGLQRFDGTRYKSFRHKENDPSAIPSNPVWELLIDQKKNLWLLMADGRVGIFDTKKFSFREVPVKLKKGFTPNTFSKHLLQDESGHLFYLVRGTELITLDENATAFSYTNNFFKIKEDWNVIDIIQQPGTQKYWMSIQGRGLAIFNKTTGHTSYAGNNTENEPAVEILKPLVNAVHFYFDKHGRLWFIKWNPVLPLIYCYDLKKNAITVNEAELNSSLKRYHEVTGFFEQQDSTIWIKGSPVFAKFLEDKKKFQLVFNGYQNEQSIAYESVSSLYEDREKNIWVATNNNGLYRFNPATEYFTNVKHLSSKSLKPGEGSPMSFVSTQWGTILAGTWEDGLYEYDKDFNPLPVNIKGFGKSVNPFAWSMFASADSNHIWLSSQPGIYVIDQAKHSYKFYNPPLLQNKTIRQIAEDRNGNVWLGMYSTGIFKWTASNGKNNFNDGISAFGAIPPVAINKITVDSKGYVWIGTPENGVYVIDPDTDKIALRFSDTSQHEKKLPERGVSSVLEYNDSLMIITTATRVVLYNRISKRSSIIGLPEMISGFITAVEKDTNGYLWLTSTSGLYRINVQKRIFIKFTRADGIDNDHFTQSASTVLPDGRMLFGTTNDVVLFDPAKIHIAPVIPAVQLTDFKVMGKSISVDSLSKLKELELGYQENSLAIEFSSLVYNTPYLIQYKLENLDKDWKMADKSNEAIYSFLPPGNYTFLLKTMDEEGNESTKITTLKIMVHPPFWKTWWFYSLLVLAVAALLFWLDRERMKRKEAIQKMRSDIADNLYQDVNTALGNINILSEMAKLKADKDPEKSKDYIQQIHSKSQQMMVAMDDMLWGISPENDSMQKTIERVREHIDSLRNRNNVEIDLLVDKKVEELKLNMKVRQTVFWFFKNGSTNIVKTGATDCKIHIALERPNLIYTLEFDNTHSDMQQLNNLLQRQELAKKLQEMKAVIDFRVHKSRSVVELSVPV